MGQSESSEKSTGDGDGVVGQYKSQTMTSKSTMPGFRHVDPDEKVSLELSDVRNKPRKCTDCLCVLILLAHWIGMSAVGIKFGTTANVNALFAPVDYRGRLCGVDSGVMDKPYGYLINGNLDMVCLSSCYDKTHNLDATKNAYDNMVCLDKLVDESYKTATATDYGYYAYNDLFGDGFGKCNFKIQTFTLGYYCVFDPDATIPNSTMPDMQFEGEGQSVKALIGSSETAGGALGKFMQDMFTARNYIFGFGFAIALLFSFAYTKMMSTSCLDILVWSCVLMTGAFLAALSGYSHQTASDWSDDPTKNDSQVSGMQAISIIFAVVTGLYACFILCVCSKIRLCIQLTKAAGHAVRDMPLIVFFPVLQVAGLVLFMVPWMYYMAYTNSQGGYCPTGDDDRLDCEPTSVVDDDSVSQPRTWQFYYDDDMVAAQYYLIFSYFWTSQFIIAMGQIIMAIAFFMWYFTPNPKVETSTSEEKSSCCAQGGHSDRGNGLIIHAFFKSWKHIGSAAFGSLVIAIIKFIRYCVLQLQRKAEQANNKCAKAVLCCIQCCLWCIEKCMKFINKHAYIIIAIDGQVGFCTAAARSFFLVLRNIRLIGAISLVQELVVLLGKILVVCATGMFSYVVMDKVIGDEVNSLVGPTLFVMVMAYIVADMFMLVYSMAIDVLAHCFLSDKESHDTPYCSRPECPHLEPLSDFIHGNEIKEKPSSASDNSANQDQGI